MWTGTPVSLDSAMSRITISSSASAGWPARPSRDDHAPSFMTPPWDSAVTSQCWDSTIDVPSSTTSEPAYSRARRIIWAS